MAHMVETMAYAGEVPWHGLGVPVSNDLTPVEMMEKAGVDWKVRELPSYVDFDGKSIATGEKSLVRESDLRVLTNVGPGWHPEEFSPDLNDQWRWTGDQAAVFFQNPNREAVLYFEVDGRPDLFEVPQKVSFFIEGKNLYEFTLDDPERRVHEIRLPTEIMGSRDVVRVDLGVDRTFRPEPQSDGDTLADLGNSRQLREKEKPLRNLSNDPRNLGIRVFYTFLEPI